MKKTPVFAPLLLALALLCAGCTDGGAPAVPSPPGGTDPAQIRLEAERLARAQLGSLDALVSEGERARVVSLLEQTIPLRLEREAADQWAKSAREERLLAQLNRLYERYTVKYLDSAGAWWGYGAPTERILAEYVIEGGRSLRKDRHAQVDESGYTEAEFLELWETMCAALPEGAWSDFSRLIVFTDGTDETLAYVYPSDSAGSKWTVAVDPADAEDWDWFLETVLHEYAHYVTLNSSQAAYTDAQTTTTYNEVGMVSYAGSYLDEFYQTFWADYLDDRLINLDSSCFFLRHADDFITDYAATDPSEDIAECFTYFVLYGPQEGEAVWEQKLDFFYRFPELVEFRTATRARLGLAEDD